MLWRIAIALSLAGCGNLADDKDLAESACWTEKGSPFLFWHVPENTEVTEELQEICTNVHNR